MKRAAFWCFVATWVLLAAGYTTWIVSGPGILPAGICFSATLLSLLGMWLQKQGK